MATDITKVTQARKADRDATSNPEMRAALALEQIADDLTALRIDFNGFVTFMGAVNRGRIP